MGNWFQNVWQLLSGQSRAGTTRALENPILAPEGIRNFQIAPDDPLLAYFHNTPAITEVDRVNIESPALNTLKAAGVILLVPLMSQGELVGLLNLGPRLSQLHYSSDDRSFLNSLAAQATPALRVAQLVRQQQIEAQARERIEQELRVASLIQQTLLPRHMPDLPGWEVASHYQPARAVGGDFFDFIPLPKGRIAIVVGDVTDKGIPAALVMATTRSVLRSVTEHALEPGQVLARANNLLCPDIPPNMFITCLYAILDPTAGEMVFANAGHDLPIRRCAGGVEELRATGMPLGLMPDMRYEQTRVMLQPGESVLFYSDGIVEAHAPSGEMFGFPRIQKLIGEHPGGPDLISFLLRQLGDFVGPGWEQEDDVTFLALRRTEVKMPEQETDNLPLAAFEVQSQPGNERQVTERVAQAVAALRLDDQRLERLKTAVAETTMNAMEHGNRFQADLLVKVEVSVSPRALHVQITDHGSSQPILEPETPDIEAKLAGLQTPRGWGLFLIKNMVDEMNVTFDEHHHTVELVIYR